MNRNLIIRNMSHEELKPFISEEDVPEEGENEETPLEEEEKSADESEGGEEEV